MPQNEIHVWRVAHPYRSRQLKSFLKLNCQAFKPVNEVSDFHAVKIVNTTSGIWQKKFIYLSESTRQQSMLFGCKPSRLSGANLPLFKGGQLGPWAQLSGAQFATFSGRTVGPRAHLVFAMIFLMIYEYFSDSKMAFQCLEWCTLYF